MELTSHYVTGLGNELLKAHHSFHLRQVQILFFRSEHILPKKGFSNFRPNIEVVSKIWFLIIIVFGEFNVEFDRL